MSRYHRLKLSQKKKIMIDFENVVDITLFTVANTKISIFVIFAQAIQVDRLILYPNFVITKILGKPT